ncbi:hypothetical protein [Streptomyces globisporus]|uniref:hypothetical protein n=1 Tax=Streptomyces globisporus TaxID=1908 RepID=UPI0019022952|nr:hypothetical protein [Streptomyces globisporus]
MARPTRKGNPSAGPVSPPVGLCTATDRHAVRFHQLRRGTSDRVRDRRVNEPTDVIGLMEALRAA